MLSSALSREIALSLFFSLGSLAPKNRNCSGVRSTRTSPELVVIRPLSKFIAWVEDSSSSAVPPGTLVSATQLYV